MAPRLYVAMSLDDLFPAKLAAIHPATNAPARATALLASLASVLVIVGSFDQIVSFLISAAMGFIALAALALIVIRRREPDAGAAAGVREPVDRRGRMAGVRSVHVGAAQA